MSHLGTESGEFVAANSLIWILIEFCDSCFVFLYELKLEKKGEGRGEGPCEAAARSCQQWPAISTLRTEGAGIGGD